MLIILDANSLELVLDHSLIFSRALKAVVGSKFSMGCCNKRFCFGSII